jgi:prephenate dehydrogenase/chorismate mutase/prephenate dehydrogenase
MCFFVKSKNIPNKKCSKDKDVNIFKHDDWNHAGRLLAETELALVCVPIECTLDVIRKTARSLDTTTALADTTSIKALIVQAMLEYHTGLVLGLHPMFGSGVNSFLSQNVVVCPATALFIWKMVVCPEMQT